MSRQLEPNSTQTPDVIFDEWLPLLTANEAKVVFFVVRKTYGWGKRHERMGAAQIVAGTGMARSTVFVACASLEAVGVLLVKHGERGGCTNDYALNVSKAETVTGALLARVDAPPVIVESSTRTSPKSGLVQTTDSPSPKSGLPLDRNPDYSKKQVRDKEETNETNVSLAPAVQANALPKHPRFTPPTIEDVSAYFTEKGRGDLAAEWFGYWDSVDWWRSRGVRMTRWRSAAAGWVETKNKQPDRKMSSRTSPPVIGGTLANPDFVQASHRPGAKLILGERAIRERAEAQNNGH